MEIVKGKSREDIIGLLAAFICRRINEKLVIANRFTFALSGGSTPKVLFELLASRYRHKIDWKKVHFFWGDERCVPYNDERNNAHMAYDALLDHIPAQPKNIHVMDTTLPPGEAVRSYNKILKTYFEEKSTSFDLTLLGLGDDGHTLSIFPGSLQELPPKEWVNIVFNKNDQLNRITLLPQIVNRSSDIVFLVTGAGKAVAVKSVIIDENPSLPATLIRPEGGSLYWYLDDAAAHELTEIK